MKAIFVDSDKWESEEVEEALLSPSTGKLLVRMRRADFPLADMAPPDFAAAVAVDTGGRVKGA